MNSCTISTLCASLTFAAGLVAQQPATVTKRTFPIQWKVGKQYLQSMTMNQEMNMLGQGEMETSMTMEISMLPSAGEKDGLTDLKMTYTKGEIEALMGGQQLPLGNAMEAFLGKSITATYDDAGKIVALEGWKELLGADPITAKLLNEDSMRQMMAQGSLMAQPGEPVSPGESWEFSLGYPMPMMKMTLKGKYTYEKDEELEGDACARLKLEGELLMEAGDVEDEAGENPEVAQARAALKAFGLKLGESKIEGVSHYSYAMSNIRRSTVELKMTMSMKDPTTQENMVMPIETKVLSTLKMQDGGK